MNGQLIAGTPIAVDYFRFSRSNNGHSQTLYFLTHAHSDHMVGLTHTWRYGFIYMSAVTARIVHHERKVQKKWLKVLEVGESKFLADNTKNKPENIVVTPIDARHCAGSVMFLFQGSFGNILYTGDFRFCDPSMLKVDALGQCSVIHRLYLDNTFCEPACDFPTREVAAAKLVEHVAADPDRKVVIGITKLGKEELLVRLAIHFRVPIAIDETTYKLYQAMGNMPNVFTMDFEGSRIHAVMQDDVRRRARDHRHDDELLIIPTGLNVGLSNNPSSTTTKHAQHKISKRIVFVPYSNHSTFKELIVFVASIRPREVIPIVNYGRHMICGWEVSTRTDMSVFDRLLDKRPVNKLLSPRSIPMLDHLEMTERVAARSWWAAPSSGKPIAWKSRSVETSKGVQFIDSPDTPLSINEENRALDQIVHFYESSEGSAVSVPFSNVVGDIFTINKDEVPEFQEEVVIECVDMNVNTEEVATVDTEEVQSSEVLTVNPSSQPDDGDEQQDVDVELNDVPVADDTSRASKQNDDFQVLDDTSRDVGCDKQVPDSTSPGDEHVTQNDDVDHPEKVPVPVETLRSGECDQQEVDMEPDAFPILVLNVRSVSEQDFQQNAAAADVKAEVHVNSIIQVDDDKQDDCELIDLTESPLPSAVSPTASPVPVLDPNSDGENQDVQVTKDLIVLDDDSQVDNKQNDDNEQTKSPSSVLISSTANSPEVLDSSSRCDNKQDDQVNSDAVGFLEIDSQQKGDEVASNDLAKPQSPIPINSPDTCETPVHDGDNQQDDEADSEVCLLLNDAFQFEDELAQFEGRINKLVLLNPGLDASVPFAAIQERKAASPIQKVMSPSTADSKDDDQMEAELMVLDWTSEDDDKLNNDENLTAASACNDLTKLQSSPISPISLPSVDATECQVEIPLQVLDDVPIFESTPLISAEEREVGFMDVATIDDRERRSVFLFSPASIDTPTQCNDDDDDDGSCSLAESVIGSTTSTVTRPRKRSGSTKEVRDAWKKTAKLFHDKRLNNEIPLYLSKDRGQCVL